MIQSLKFNVGVEQEEGEIGHTNLAQDYNHIRLFREIMEEWREGQRFRLLLQRSQILKIMQDGMVVI
jgi:hypothetical protein